uniref:Uncharacterized protein n=1 Tax=Aegilops tauschii subsp. strangulata TaxID=200361 RepID=A0A453EBE7_AEGTS
MPVYVAHIYVRCDLFCVFNVMIIQYRPISLYSYSSGLVASTKYAAVHRVYLQIVTTCELYEQQSIKVYGSTRQQTTSRCIVCTCGSTIAI